MTPQLTQTQYAALKVVAQGDGTAAGLIAAGDDQALANWFNTVDATYWVWLNRYDRVALRKAAVQGSAEMDNLEAGKRDALYWLIGDDLDPSVPSVRSAFVDLTANRQGGFVATALRSTLSAGAKRNATRAEKALAVQVQGSDNGTSANPMKAAFEGPMSAAEASLVRVA